MAGALEGKTVAFLAAEGVEQVELTEPWKAVEEAGGKPELLSTEAGEVQAFNHLDKADTFSVDRVVGDADASDYDGLVLPGGRP
jgi:protease I